MSKRGLGKGLSDLLSSSSTQYEEALPDNDGGKGAIEVPVGSITPNPWQPRKVFSKERLTELADSIREHGIIQPLIVRKKGLNYELVAGERRLRAAKQAKLKTVPVLVREYDEREMRELALVENIQRHDLNPIDEAKAIRDLMDSCGYTQDKVAKKLGRSRAAVANLLRMLNLPSDLQKLVAREKVTAGQMRPVLALTDKAQQKQVAEAVVENGWSARTVETVVKTLKDGGSLEVVDGKVALREVPVITPEIPAAPGEDPSGKQEDHKKKDDSGKDRRKDTPEPDVHYSRFEDALISYLGTKVRISRKNDNVGRIEIDFYSPEDLERICELLRGQETKPAAPVKKDRKPKKLHV